MGGLSVIVLMNILLFLYLFFITIFVAIILYTIIGKLVTYGDIAKEIASNHHIKRMSAQAVGGAVGSNPICIIVPCHRMVGASNNLTGYGGGIRNKIALLEVEGHNLEEYKLPKEK